MHFSMLSHIQVICTKNPLFIDSHIKQQTSQDKHLKHLSINITMTVSVMFTKVNCNLNLKSFPETSTMV